jgi:hypothetical protein
LKTELFIIYHSHLPLDYNAPPVPWPQNGHMQYEEVKRCGKGDLAVKELFR